MEGHLFDIELEQIGIASEKTIGERIGALAEKQGKNLRSVATEAGISYNTLYAMVRRKSNKVNISNLKKIASALGVTIGYLLGNEPINAKMIYEAWLTEDYRTFEKLEGLPEGSVSPLTAEELAEYAELWRDSPAHTAMPPYVWLKGEDGKKSIFCDLSVAPDLRGPEANSFDKYGTVEENNDRFLEALGYESLTSKDNRKKALLDAFANLNSLGQRKAIEQVQDLTQIPKYKNEEPKIDKVDSQEKQ